MLSSIKFINNYYLLVSPLAMNQAIVNLPAYAGPTKKHLLTEEKGSLTVDSKFRLTAKETDVLKPPDPQNSKG